MAKPKVFVASSRANLEVARAIATGLENERSCAEVTIWSEGVFGLNDNLLQRLFAAPGECDFAVSVWAPDDVTNSGGQARASPRDNVIFECGLFMGVLGLDRVFAVQDSKANIKIPSDFAGITLAEYDGTRMQDNPSAAVRTACDLIQAAISKAPYKELEGEWRQRYTGYEDIEPSRVEEDIEISVSADTVSITRHAESDKEVVFSARGRLNGNRIRGEWHHKKSGVLDRGPFLLVVTTASDVLYGYSSAYDVDGGAIFQAWVLAKKAEQTDAKIAELLSWGEKTLKERTVGLPIVGIAPGHQ